MEIIDVYMPVLKVSKSRWSCRTWYLMTIASLWDTAIPEYKFYREGQVGGCIALYVKKA